MTLEPDLSSYDLSLGGNALLGGTATTGDGNGVTKRDDEWVEGEIVAVDKGDREPMAVNNGERGNGELVVVDDGEQTEEVLAVVYEDEDERVGIAGVAMAGVPRVTGEVTVAVLEDER